MGEIMLMALYGSPRVGGNTEIIMDEFLRGAENEGAKVDRLYVRKHCIAPCNGCLSCFQTGQCVIADDMQQIYPRLLAADIVVLASPIFFYGVTAGIKALIDRAQALWGRRYVLKDPTLGEGGKKREGVFISVGGTKGRRMFEGAILTVKYFFDAFHAQYGGELLFREVDGKGDILKQPGALEEARTMGGKQIRNWKAARAISNANN